MLSKEQEVKKFERWYKSLEEGSYLKMIFEGIHGYVENQIKNDLGLSLFDRIESAYQEQTKANSRAHKAETELKNQKSNFRFIAQKIGRTAKKKWELLKDERRQHRYDEDETRKLFGEKQDLTLRAVKAENEAERLQTEVKRQFGVIVENNLKIIKLKEWNEILKGGKNGS